MNVLEYIEGFLSIENMQIERLAKEDKDRNDIQPCVGLHTGKLLSLLIRLINAKKVLEFGTCIGYSAIWMGEALKSTGGKLISVEYNEKLYYEAKKNIERAGLSSVIELIHGDASQVAKELEGEFDIILQDSSKPLYTEMLDKCIELTRKNGLIIADDTLFKPMGIPVKFSEPMDRYNKMVFSDKRIYSTILPIGDGATISVKLAD